jgi:hypothetical protein
MKTLRLFAGVLLGSFGMSLAVVLLLGPPAVAEGTCRTACPKVFCVYNDCSQTARYTVFRKFARYADIECGGPFDCGYEFIACTTNCGEIPPPER